MPDLTPAKLDAIEARAADQHVAFTALDANETWALCRALRAAWEERDRAPDMIEAAYREGWIDCKGYNGHSIAAAWQQSGARRALTPPGEGAK